MTNATTSKGWDMSGSNAELIKDARAAHWKLGTTNVCVRDDEDWPCDTIRLANALEAAGAERDVARAGIESAREWWNEGNTNRTELGLILFENMQ